VPWLERDLLQDAGRRPPRGRDSMRTAAALPMGGSSSSGVRTMGQVELAQVGAASVSARRRRTPSSAVSRAALWWTAERASLERDAETVIQSTLSSAPPGIASTVSSVRRATVCGSGADAPLAANVRLLGVIPRPCSRRTGGRGRFLAAEGAGIPPSPGGQGGAPRDELRDAVFAVLDLDRPGQGAARVRDVLPARRTSPSSPRVRRPAPVRNARRESRVSARGRFTVRGVSGSRLSRTVRTGSRSSSSLTAHPPKRRGARTWRPTADTPATSPSSDADRSARAPRRRELHGTRFDEEVTASG
jgi:hypothetical protein